MVKSKIKIGKFTFQVNYDFENASATYVENNLPDLNGEISIKYGTESKPRLVETVEPSHKQALEELSTTIKKRLKKGK